jgi:GT2 family glycosyltransferase/glycosyltransferase involved in cell wall biosynthesis
MPEALRGHLGEIPQTKVFTPDFLVPVERLMPRHADIETREFPTLADLVGEKRLAKRALKICIATFHFEGPTRASGLAVEYRKLAEVLSDAGHAVTVLYMRGRNCEQDAIGQWVAHYAAAGITLVPLPPADVPAAPGIVASALVRSRAAYEWLKQQDFDLVHGAPARGALFVALTAKRLGLAFEKTLFAVEAWPPTIWALQVDGEPIRSLRDLAVSYSERRSIELADVVISPSRHMLRWMMRHGYDLPLDRCFVQPPLVSAAGAAPADARVQKAISELVFVGSFDSRKGIGAVSRAAETLRHEFPDLVVTYLAQPSADFSLKDRLLKSPHARVVEIEKPADALAYLTGEGRLAILPSYLDHVPEILAQFVERQIPLLVLEGGGATDMIDAKDRAAVICAGAPADIAEKVRAVLRDGAVVPRFAVAAEQNETIWRDAQLALASPQAHRRFASQAAHRTWHGQSPKSRRIKPPLVSVCVAHFNRPTQLADTIASIRAQTYRNIEIVVVDDGSTEPAAKDYLDRLGAELLAERAGRVVRQANRYLGAARNTGVRASRGEFILTIDDDDLAKPEEIATFVSAADFSGADILCCYSDTFSGADAPANSAYHDRITPLGDSVSLGLFMNCLGTSHAFFRREIFDALGGFTEDYGVGLDDHEFLLRAVLRGCKLMVVPEALYWYRLSPLRLRDLHYDRMSGKARVFNAILDNAPLALHEALQFAQNMPDINPAQATSRWCGWLGEVRQRRDARAIRASGHFDEAYYRAANPDVAANGVDPALHYLRYGMHEGRKPSAVFDPLPYLDDLPDAGAAGVDPLVHFIRSGGRG